MPYEDHEADLGTKYLERDRVKKCVTRMEMLFAGASAGEQLPVVSGTEVIIGEDLIEGQSDHWSGTAQLCACCMSPKAKQDDDLDHSNVTERRGVSHGILEISWSS